MTGPALQNFREVVSCRVRKRNCWHPPRVAPYDALMNKYEPGMQSADIDRIFAAVKQWLPGLIAQVMDKQAQEKLLLPQSFPVEQQRQLGLAVMGLLGLTLMQAGWMSASIPSAVAYRKTCALPPATGKMTSCKA
jgi:carboxypeptidase Taq